MVNVYAPVTPPESANVNPFGLSVVLLINVIAPLNVLLAPAFKVGIDKHVIGLDTSSEKVPVQPLTFNEPFALEIVPIVLLLETVKILLLRSIDPELVIPPDNVTFALGNLYVPPVLITIGWAALT